MSQEQPVTISQTIDVVKRAVPRLLPCKLSEEEFVRISRTRVAKEAERDQLVADADLDSRKRKAQIKEYDDEIIGMRRELHSGYQDRTIKTNELFEKDVAGNCWIVIYRLDTNEPTGERWPASASEMQRYLPSMDAPGGLLEQATKTQRSVEAEPTTEADVPTDLPDDDDDDVDDDADDDEPKKRGKKGK